MKEIDETRFQKKRRDDINFTAPPIAESPPEQAGKPAPTKDFSQNRPPYVRPSVRKEQEGSATDTYVIIIPEERRKIRHAFDICEDQLDALKKIQMAERVERGAKASQKLGEMAQEALDAFIREKVKKLSNVSIRE